MAKASDLSIYAMISLDKEYLDSYASRPDLCVGYALGTMEFMQTAPKDYVSRGNDLKSKVILSALDTPSDRVMPADIDGVREMIFTMYAKNGYALADLALLGSLGTAPLPMPAGPIRTSTTPCTAWAPRTAPTSWRC
jgi:hypothetical protein